MIPGTRIAFVSHSAQPAGGEIYLVRLAKHLNQSSPSLHFMADGAMPAKARALGLQVITFPTRPSASFDRKGRLLPLLRGSLKLWRDGYELDRNSPHTIDYVIAWSIRALPASYVFARRRNVPLIWSVHDRLSSDYFGWLNKTILKLLGRILADGFIVNSEITRATLSSGRKPVALIYPGIELRQIAERKLSGSPETPIEIVMVGRLAEWKGQHILLQALSTIQVNRKFNVTIVGGALFGEEEYANELRRSAPPNVLFTGHSDAVDHYIDNADILVHASISPEPFGLSVLEGMNSGCAVIATTPGGPSEMIKHGISGLLVNCNDVDALASAIVTLLENSALRAKLGSAAQLRSKEFDIRQSAVKLESWLKDNFRLNRTSSF